MDINWNTKNLYRPYKDWSADHLRSLQKKVQKSIWRLGYHIQPNTGLLNDPNGFSFFNGKWNLFYQVFPYGPVHGLKSWQHLISDDLIHWTDLGLALTPDSKYDSQGVYSGSAMNTPEGLALMYTGNVRDAKWERTSYQNITFMDPKYQIIKNKKPLITTPKDIFTEDIRDPQLLKINNAYKVILGAQKIDKKGAIAVFQGNSLDSQFKYQGILNFAQDDLGKMVECPNLVFVDQRPVLIFCPQGLDHHKLAYQNIYPNTYVIGDSIDWQNLKINEPSQIKNLDDGFDLYATQAFNAPGRALAVGWIGLPDSSYPSDKDGWSGALSLVKELKIKNGQLIQYPVNETKLLRKSERTFAGQLNQTTNQYELELTIPVNKKVQIKLFTSPESSHYLGINIDTSVGWLDLDRSHCFELINSAFGEIRRSIFKPGEALKLNIFVDNSVVEIYLNDGTNVLTSRYFPLAKESGIKISDPLKAKIWDLQ